MPRKRKRTTKKPMGRLEQRLRNIEMNMVRPDDLARIYDDLEEIKTHVSRKRRRRGLSLFSNKSQDDTVNSPVPKAPTNSLDIQKALQLAQNPMVQSMIKNFIK